MLPSQGRLQSFCGDVAVAVTLPAVAGAASPADLAEAVVVDVTWRMLGSRSQPTTGVVTVGVTSLADAGMVTLDVTELAVAGVAPLADAGIVFPVNPAGMVTVGMTNLTDVTPVNVIGVPECG